MQGNPKSSETAIGGTVAMTSSLFLDDPLLSETSSYLLLPTSSASLVVKNNLKPERSILSKKHKNNRARSHKRIERPLARHTCLKPKLISQVVSTLLHRLCLRCREST